MKERKIMLQFSILTIGTFVTMLDSISILICKICFKKDIKKIVPILSLIFGLGLGIAGYYTPNVDMGNNLIEAIFIGLSAGAATTGVNQVGRQLTKNEQYDASATVLDLKKFIDSIDVPEDITNDIPCDGNIDNTQESVNTNISSNSDEVVPSETDENDK